MKNLHILLIEDIAPMRELTSAILKAQGVGRVSHASDGEKGFDEFCKCCPDIVITDWQMPAMNGIDLVKMIRTSQLSPNKTVPVIMMTGYGSPLKISNARDAGVTEFLVKPFSARDISKRILHIIKSPRDFIVTPTYAGPDRRRKEVFTPLAANLRTNPTGYSKLIKANYLLQAKVGLGIVPEDAILKSQSLIEKNGFDFGPVATLFLKQLKDGLDLAKSDRTQPFRRIIERLVTPIMQIKANARIFRYGLLGDLAHIMLDFLEGVNELDPDVIDIIEANHKTLTHIVNTGMKGEGGEIGRAFKTELQAACNRYITTRITRQKERMTAALEENRA